MSGLNQYDPKEIQDRWSSFWDEKGFFHSEPNSSKQPFSIVIPPPNVTGVLHLGHALNGTIQDVVIRSKRMRGFECLWMPGADHAGIATQAVVERKMFENEGKTRHDVGREELVRRIWEWKDEHEQSIIGQFKAIGCSCDWPRWRFTLDETCATAVRHTFFKMFRDGLIYRGKRLVNWDSHLQTAVADDEVYHEKVTGNLWHFKYPVEGSDELLEIATTRPETMLGDTAVAVHPKDSRYQHLIGKKVRLPLVDRLIPVVADGLLVDPEFGTGVVKVTPAHDPNDYACGLRNDLEMINILTADGHINENGGPYQGLHRKEARKKVVADLEALGLVSKIEPHVHNVGHSDRSKTPIEPFLSDQWFVKMDDLAETAMAAVRDGRVRMHPERYANTYLQWLSEKRDWCISRQLWWGHQIPIWYCDSCTEDDLKAAFGENSQDVSWHYDQEKKQWLICGLEDLDDTALSGHTLTRDPDVLDTWFSSALWPHSTMGWPKQTQELEYYYPTSLLSTARDIITLWVARMVLMSEYNLKQIPFQDVFIHPVIQDGEGQRMSKSLGNGVDPFDIIESYGADALRYTLISMTTETQDARLPVKKEKLEDGRVINTSERFELGRNFGTKIYNASKFMIMNLEGYTSGPVSDDQLMTEDRWILCRLSQTIRSVTTHLDAYQFADVAKTLYDFVWGELCDWYIEIVKPRFRDESLRPTAQRVSAFVLDQTLRLLHPIMPFLTEEVWSALGEVASERGLESPKEAEQAVTVASWPIGLPDHEHKDIVALMGDLQEVIRSIRNIRGQFGVDTKAQVDVLIECDQKLADFLKSNVQTIQNLSRVGSVEAGPEVQRPAKSAAHIHAHSKIYVPLAEHIDLDAEVSKQEKKQADLQKRLKGVQGKLSNDGFVAKAPAEVVARQRELAEELKQQIEDVETVLSELRG